MRSNVFSAAIATFVALVPVTVLSDVTSVCRDQAQLPSDDIAVRPDVYYGDRVVFDVRRNGSSVGRHETAFSWQDGALSVTSEMTLKVRVLFFTAYRFSYEAQSLWCGGELLTLTARVDENGRTREIEARRDGGVLAVEGPEGVAVAEPSILPTEHWNPSVVNDSRVINTLSGRINAVEIEDLGPATVNTVNGPIEARHYRYTGELRTEVWYDEKGRWVKLRFEAEKDGSVIEYVCETCKPPSEARTASREGV